MIEILKKLYREILIFLFFILLTIISTYPLIVNIGTSIYGYPKHHGDPFGIIWGIWWFKYTLMHRISPDFISIVASPFGIDTTGNIHQPVLEYPMKLLALFFNEAITYNLIVILGFVLTAITMYFLVFYFTKNRSVSLLSGVIFSFYPDHVMHSAQHIGFAILWWIPLYVLFLFKLSEKRTYKNAFFCALFFSFVTLSNYYYGYFMVIFTTCFILYKIGYSYFNNKKVSLNIRTAKVILVTLILCVLIIVPFTYSIFRAILSPSEMRIVETQTYVRAYKDLFKYAARWQDYFLPSEFHPFFGKMSTNYVKSHWGGRHYFERSLYLGFVPIFLSVLAIGKWVIGKIKNTIFEKNEDYIISFFLFSGAIALLFSLSPEITIGKLKIPMPSFFMYKVIPMFRVYARFGVLAMLSVSILAGMGLKYLLESIKKRGRRVIVTTCITSLLLFEFINIPPFHNIDLSKTPAVYEWLAKEEGNIIIAEYPLVRSIDERHYDYLFYQRIHQKRVINGAQIDTFADAVRKEAGNIANPETPSLLSYLGAKYVILHKDVYNPEDIKEINNNPGLVFVKDFPEAVVYEVVAEKPDLVEVFWKRFASWEKWGDGSLWRWAGNNATLWLGNAKEKDIEIDLEFTVLSFSRERTLEIFLNDKSVKNMQVLAPPDISLAQAVTFRNLELKPGENIIRFFTPQGETKIDDILGNGDRRRVSFAFSNFKIRTR